MSNVYTWRITLASVRIDGFKGMVYVPEKAHGIKKHPCADCFSCGCCSDERCNLCLKEKPHSVNVDCLCDSPCSNNQD